MFLKWGDVAWCPYLPRFPVNKNKIREGEILMGTKKKAAGPHAFEHYPN